MRFAEERPRRVSNRPDEAPPPPPRPPLEPEQFDRLQERKRSSEGIMRGGLQRMSSMRSAPSQLLPDQERSLSHAGPVAMDMERDHTPIEEEIVEDECDGKMGEMVSPDSCGRSGARLLCSVCSRAGSLRRPAAHAA